MLHTGKAESTIGASPPPKRPSPSNREAGDIAGEARALGDLGNALGVSGDLDRSRQSHERALVLLHDVGDLQAEARELGNLGLLLRRIEDFDAARADHQDAAELLESLELVAEAAKSRFHLSAVLLPC